MSKDKCVAKYEQVTVKRQLCYLYVFSAAPGLRLASIPTSNAYLPNSLLAKP